MLHAVPDRIRLQKLGAEDEGIEVLWIQIGLGEVVHDLSVGRAVSLVHLHDAGEDVPVLRQGKAPDRLHRGEGLEAELREEPVVMAPVGGKRLIAVPDAPVVGVPLVLRVAVLKVSSGRWRRRPVERIRILPPHHVRNQALKEADVVIVLLFGLRPVPGLILGLHLVVAAPQCQAGMGAKAPDVLADLQGDVLLEGRVQLISCAGEHHVLPDENPLLITEVVDRVITEVSASPDAHAVVMRLLCRGEQEVRPLPALPGENAVLRDVIRAHRKDGKAVHGDGKVSRLDLLSLPGDPCRHVAPIRGKHELSVVVVRPLSRHVRIALFLRKGIGIDGHRAKTDAPCPGVQSGIFADRAQLHLCAIQRLFPVFIRPPELRILHRKVQLQMICAKRGPQPCQVLRLRRAHANRHRFAHRMHSRAIRCGQDKGRLQRCLSCLREPLHLAVRRKVHPIHLISLHSLCRDVMDLADQNL